MSTPARAILSRRVDDEGLKNNNSNTNNNSSSAKRPRLSAVGSVTEMAIEKQQNLRKAIQSLWEESRLYNEARDAQEVAMRKSSFFMASHRKPSLSLTSFKVANKWRLLVEDLLTLPEDLIEEEVLSQFSKLLYAHHSFFRSDLGECNELGKDFFDVQMVLYCTCYVALTLRLLWCCPFASPTALHFSSADYSLRLFPSSCTAL